MDISFEFFPPKTDDGLSKLVETSKVLHQFAPAYFSVTYGAGGSTRERTVLTVETLQSNIKQTIVPHLSCVGATKEVIAALLERYQARGIKKIIALRGDLPSGDASMSGDFRYASELVSFIRKQTGDYFNIEVAVYPECHPQSDDAEMDLRYFKQKINAGANGAITQYFYNANAYYWLLENCKRQNITVPITPGIMPIMNFKQLCRFSDNCGAEIPRWMKKQMMSYADDRESIQQFGIEIVTRMCEELISLGAPGLHFYTLNKHDLVTQILKNLNVTEIKHETVSA